MKKLLLLIFLFSVSSYAKEVRIGIPDTGFDLTKVQKSVKLCAGTQIYNTSLSDSLQDVSGHGTTVLRYIESKIQPGVNHCYVLVKMFSNGPGLDKKPKLGYNSIVEALKILKKNKVDIVNLSYGSEGQIFSEKLAVKELLDSSIIIVAASGNNGLDLNVKCNYYPACYDSRIVVVGDKEGTKANYGKDVDLKYSGNGMVCPAESDCVPNWGTSFSAARITGLMINKFQKFTNLINNKKVYLSKEKK